MLLLAVIIIFKLVNSYKFTLPYGVNWIGQFDNIDIIKNREKCKIAFNSIPILIFKNQELTNEQYYDVVSSFDKYYKKSGVIHPFTRDIDNPHIGICNNLKSSSINFNNVWHMDNVGKYELPNVVTSFYFGKVPEKGGETIFANLPNAYAKIERSLKFELDNINCIYEKSDIYIQNNIYSINGFRRLNKIIPKETISNKLIFKPYKDQGYSMKSIMFSPIRFLNFDYVSEENSWDMMDYIFSRYINTPDNIISLKWNVNDLVIFNNRLLLHTTTPTEIYNEERHLKVIFLNTKQKI